MPNSDSYNASFILTWRYDGIGSPVQALPYKSVLAFPVSWFVDVPRI